MVSQAASGEQVYATLLLTDAYLAGALVIGNSLKDAGTTKKLIVLVTTDSVSEEAVAKLKTVYDQVIPVPRIRNDRQANLHLMGRTDLHSAFTKIQLWKLTQFSRIVYVDSDIVAYRAPDELFNIPHMFGAAPDIGWPDIFNTGVMVLTPNMGDYHAMSAMAERGISFDGADQGLLNQYFGSNYHRLPFTYNVTPSAHYQYLPAYNHFQSSINMVHFIGKNKPWVLGPQATSGNGAFDEMIGRWWAVFDRHYYGQDAYNIVSSTAESWSSIYGRDASRQGQRSSSGSESTNTQSSEGTTSHSYGYQYQAPPPIFPWEGTQPKPARCFFGDPQPTRAPTLSTLVAAVPAAKAPEPVSREATPQPIASESHYEREPQSPFTAPSVSEMDTMDNRSEAVTPTTPSRYSNSGTWTSFPHMANAWDEVPAINRYVEVLEKYRRASIKSSKNAPVVSRDDQQEEVQMRGTKVTDFPTETERPSLPVTPAPVRRSSFWSQDETEAGNDVSLPAAEGVPVQSEWVCMHGLQWRPTDCLCHLITDVVINHKDPLEQLQKLAAQQSDVLLRKLGGEQKSFDGIPFRPMPFGSQDVIPMAHHTHSVPTLISPVPLKGSATVRTSSLERKMQKGESGLSDTRPITWDEDEGTEFSYHEREALEA